MLQHQTKCFGVTTSDLIFSSFFDKRVLELQLMYSNEKFNED